MRNFKYNSLTAIFTIKSTFAFTHAIQWGSCIALKGIWKVWCYVICIISVFVFPSPAVVHITLAPRQVGLWVDSWAHDGKSVKSDTEQLGLARTWHNTFTVDMIMVISVSRRVSIAQVQANQLVQASITALTVIRTEKRNPIERISDDAHVCRFEPGIGLLKAPPIRMLDFKKSHSDWMLSKNARF